MSDRLSFASFRRADQNSGLLLMHPACPSLSADGAPMTIKQINNAFTESHSSDRPARGALSDADGEFDSSACTLSTSADKHDGSAETRVGAPGRAAP